MGNGSSERDSGSSKAILFVFYRCPSPTPLRKPHPVWTTTAIRDHYCYSCSGSCCRGGGNPQTTKRSSLEAMLQQCVYCRAITHYEELRCCSLIEVSITLLKIVESLWDFPQHSTKSSLPNRVIIGDKMAIWVRSRSCSTNSGYRTATMVCTSTGTLWSCCAE